MRRRHLLRVLAAAALVAAGWTALRPAPGSEALGGIETGSWWQGGQSGQRPPQVDEGGLWVSGTPATQNAISAVRFRLDDLESNPLLTLEVKSETATPVPGVSACAATSSWTASTSPQAWIERPAFDCGQLQVNGQRSSDGKTLLFDLGGSGQFVNVVLVPTPRTGPVPGVAAPAPLPPPPVSTEPAYDVVFAPVDASAVNVRSSVEDDDFDFGSDFAMPSFEVPFGPTDFGTFDPVAPPPASPDLAAPPAPPAARPQPSAAIRPPGSGDRAVAAVVFCLLALWWFRLSYAPAPGVRRARLTLHDDPRYVPHRESRPGGTRQGRVPALR